MKKASRLVKDDLRPEYDVGVLGAGVRGKYAGRLKETTMVTLEPEIARAFPTSQAVNETLRAVLRSTVVRRPGPARKGASRSTGRGQK